MALVIFVGTLGFYLIEPKYTLFDSFFMTIITVSTVGFHEVHALSDLGRLFTSFLIITSFGTFAYAVSAITSYLVGGEYKTYFREYQLNRELEKVTNHVIVCGFGRVGKQAAADLAAHNREFLVMESDDSIVEENRLQEDSHYHFVAGDATVDEHLLKAGIKRASALITTLPKDSDNLFVVLSAKELNPKLRIISRASSQSSVRKLKIAGADNVIMPDRVGGAHMASLVVTPDVVEFLDHISVQGDNHINLEEISFNELPENFQFKTIGELNARQITGCNIIGFKTAGGEYLINPAADTEVIPNSKLFVLGDPEQITKLNKVLGI